MATINSKRQPLFIHKSQVQSLVIEKNEDYIIQVLDGKITYPLLVSLNMLLVPPNSQAFKENDMSTSNKLRKRLLLKNSENRTKDNFLSNGSNNINEDVNQFSITRNTPIPARIHHQMESVNMTYF